jgi:hypothetical protein
MFPDRELFLGYILDVLHTRKPSIKRAYFGRIFYV